MSLAASSIRYCKHGMRRGNELDVDEEYDNDGTLAMYESRAKKGDKDQQIKREKARQVSDYRSVASCCSHLFGLDLT